MALKYDANTDLLQGDKVYLFVKDLPIAFGTSLGLDITRDTIDTGNKMSGGWKASIPGMRSFSISSESLLTKKAGAMSFDTLFAAMNRDEPIDFVYGLAADTFELAAGWYKGKVLITSLGNKADNGANCTCSCTLTGTGALESIPAPTSTVIVKAAQTYVAGADFKQLIFLADGAEKTTGGVWSVTVPKAGIGVTPEGLIFAKAGTTGAISVSVSYNGISSAAVPVTVTA